MTCEFPSLVCGTACYHCGYTLKKDYEVQPYRNCPGPPCNHLGIPIERDGVTIKVKCGCTGKEHDQPHVAHECTLYNRCLPTLRPADLAAWLARKPESDLYHLCHGCDRGATREN